jgi:DNA-binding transcriptional LysR family regulator
MDHDDLARLVQLRQLQAIDAVAESRSFTRAAQRLGYAQSAVSQQVAALERAVGVRLVDRPGGPRPVSLTEAGEITARHAHRLLAGVAALGADLRALAAGEAGTLRIGIFQSAGARILPRALRAFRRALPEVEVELTEHYDDRALLERVAAGELDLTFALDPGDDGFGWAPLLVDDWVAISSPASDLVSGRDGRALELVELDGLPLITWSPDCHCQQILDRALERAGVTPHVVARTSDTLTLQRLVATGLGHAVVGGFSVEVGGQAGRLVSTPVAGDITPRTIGLAWADGRHQTAAARAFVDAAARSTGSASAP